MGNSIVWHFEGTSITSVYGSEEERDKAFEALANALEKGVRYYHIGDTITNASKVLCITKGAEEWKSVKEH